MNNLDKLLPVLILLAASMYICGTVAVVFKKSYGKYIVCGGWAINIFIFITNWMIVGYPPFANMYQIMIFLSLCFLPMFIVVEKSSKADWILPYFSLASAMPLIGVMFMEREVVWELSPALQSIWFVPHVLSYMISYALSSVAFILGISLLITNKRINDKKRTQFEQAIYSILKLAFPFMTIGLCLGAIWAEEAWGTYWSWDTKETWSLITWMLYLVYFHSFRSKVHVKKSNIYQITAFIALLITFLMVNYLPQLASALHGYTSR